MLVALRHREPQNSRTGNLDGDGILAAFRFKRPAIDLELLASFDRAPHRIGIGRFSRAAPNRQARLKQRPPKHVSALNHGTPPDFALLQEKRRQFLKGR